MRTSTTLTFITEALRLVISLQLAVLKDCYSEVTAYKVLAYSYWASLRDACMYDYVMLNIDAI